MQKETAKYPNSSKLLYAIIKQAKKSGFKLKAVSEQTGKELEALFS